MSYKLDSFQIDAIESLYENLNVLVTAPTGAGKTIIAERGIEEYLDKGNRVIYTTPIKALSNQKYHDFMSSGFDTGLLTGDRNENPDAGLIIATTEILRNMIFTNDERINDIGLVVLDEVHYLADKERGSTWEEIIIHLPKDIKLLCLSATIGNENEFLNWIVSQRGPTDLIQSKIRPVPLEISLITASKDDEQILAIKSTEDKRNKPIFKLDKKFKRFRKPSLSDQISYIMNKKATPCILFYFSREKVENKARYAANLNFKIKKNVQLRHLFEDIFDDITNEEYQLLNLDELYWMWSRGVAYHHAGLAPIVKEFVEFLFINRHIDILFATETLSLGINMPAKSIIIDSSFKYDGLKTRLISKSEFLQLTGRAGRRGIDSKGYAYINYDKRVENSWYNDLFDLKPNNLKSSYSNSYGSVLNLNNKYGEKKGIDMIKKSFYSYQNKLNDKALETNYKAKLKVLNEMNYFTDLKKNKLLTETHRDNLILGIELLNENNDIEFCLMFLASGISTSKYEISVHDKYNDLLTKYLITQEKVNKLEAFSGVKNKINLDITWFSIFLEFYNSDNIEYTLSKFNVTLGDFIKACREASEISQKVYSIYEIENFDKIAKKLKHNIIQKTMI
uniref:Superfamily II RNA helicase n=1 Tax=Candidatus Actinomarina minuta TaxID=1389454 RepID=S5DJA5_9ACTN|nr:superfamily II RNA helicase [Candidatus Actinomarina minuta]